MTNESKVVAWRWRSPHMIAANEPPSVTGDEALIAKVNGQGWEVEGLVTHADYRALEERYEALKVTEREGYAEYHRTRVELASIKARVESMQDRIDAYQEKGLAK